MAEANALTLEVAAALLEISPRRVQQLAKEGWIPKADRGRYPLVGTVQGYIRFLQDEARRTSKSASESRVRDMRADEIAMRMEEKSKALIKEARAEALAIVDEVLGGFRADLYALPARVTGDLEQRKKIEAAIDAAFREAAKRAADSAPGPSADHGVADASATDHTRSMGTRKPRIPSKRRRSRPS